MHSTFSPIKVVKVFSTTPRGRRSFLEASDSELNNLRHMTELRDFMGWVRDRSGHRIAALVWEEVSPCLAFVHDLKMQPSHTLRCELTPDKRLSEIAQRDHWLRIFDKRLIRPNRGTE